MVKKLTSTKVGARIITGKKKEIKERIAASCPLCMFYCQPGNPESTNTWNDLIDVNPPPSA